VFCKETEVVPSYAANVTSGSLNFYAQNWRAGFLKTAAGAEIAAPASQ
jgi:hypothetical protein